MRFVSHLLAPLALLAACAGSSAAQQLPPANDLPESAEQSLPYNPRWAGEESLVAEPGVDFREEPKLGLGERFAAFMRGRVQLEGGWVYTYDSEGGVRTSEHALPDMLLRIGLTERLELRIGWPGYVHTSVEDEFGRFSDGRALDPNVGFLLDLCPQQGWIPQTGVLVSVPIRLEGDPLALSSLQPLNQVLYAWYPSDRLSVGGTTGFSLFDEYGDRYTQFQQSVNADYLLTERFGAFAEWTVLVDHGSDDDGAEHMLGSGLSWLCTDEVQLSWRLGVGLNERAPDFLTGVRCAVRF